MPRRQKTPGARGKRSSRAADSKKVSARISLRLHGTRQRAARMSRIRRSRTSCVSQRISCDYSLAFHIFLPRDSIHGITVHLASVTRVFYERVCSARALLDHIFMGARRACAQVSLHSPSCCTSGFLQILFTPLRENFRSCGLNGQEMMRVGGRETELCYINS